MAAQPPPGKSIGVQIYMYRINCLTTMLVLFFSDPNNPFDKFFHHENPFAEHPSGFEYTWHNLIKLQGQAMLAGDLALFNQYQFQINVLVCDFISRVRARSGKQVVGKHVDYMSLGSNTVRRISTRSLPGSTNRGAVVFPNLSSLAAAPPRRSRTPNKPSTPSRKKSRGLGFSAPSSPSDTSGDGKRQATFAAPSPAFASAPAGTPNGTNVAASSPAPVFAGSPAPGSTFASVPAGSHTNVAATPFATSPFANTTATATPAALHQAANLAFGGMNIKPQATRTLNSTEQKGWVNWFNHGKRTYHMSDELARIYANWKLQLAVSLSEYIRLYNYIQDGGYPETFNADGTDASFV